MVLNQLQICEKSEQGAGVDMNRKDYTIYIVDDDESVRRALKRLFKSAGLRAETFGSAIEFQNAAHPDAPSCLILDVMMPGIGGLELQEHLKAVKINIPIIFISAYEDKEVCTKAMKEGAKAFLPKPVNGETLLADVYSALRNEP